MLTPESFAICFICIVMLVFFMNENRHEENMKKIKKELDMDRMNFIVLHRVDTDRKVAILADAITGFGEEDDTHACTVYFDNTSVTVCESYDRIANMLKNIAVTNLEWSDSKSRFNFSFSPKV